MAKKRERLPETYDTTIAEIEGRYYPMRVEKRYEDGTVQCSGYHNYWDVEDMLGIPYALGPQPTQGIISFKSYQIALDFCHRRHEGYGLWYHWRVLTAQSELYPERNAWYYDEISTLARDQPEVSASGDTAVASVFPGGEQICFVSASNIDEAWERLYESVCTRLAQQQSA